MLYILLLLAQDPFDDAARAFESAYKEGKAEALFARYGEPMKKALPLDATEEFLASTKSASGEIVSVKRREKDEVPADMARYDVQLEKGPFILTIVKDKQGLIAGLWLRALEPDVEHPRNKAAMALPFSGPWTVVHGGDTVELNYHVTNPMQRYAVDLVVTDAEGASHKGEGRKNEDYYAWGKEILAPADGVVEEAVDGVRDNVPGEMNPYMAAGNVVILKHGEREYSFLAHFRRGSVRVKAGDAVKRGDVLGLCGNSGNSSEPHLHFHLMDDPRMQAGRGIKCYFDRAKLTRGGKTEDRGDLSPIRGDIVE